MKVLIVLCLAAMALADEKKSHDGYDKHDGYDAKHGHYDGPYDGHYGGYGYAYGANRYREARVNYVNGLRQHAVNAAAEHYGAGTGTAAKYGVPGTPVGVNYGYGHGYGHGYPYGYGHRYGYGGYGYGKY